MSLFSRLYLLVIVVSLCVMSSERVCSQSTACYFDELQLLQIEHNSSLKTRLQRVNRELSEVTETEIKLAGWLRIGDFTSLFIVY